MGFAWNLILFSFMREREGYKHHADCTVLVYTIHLCRSTSGFLAQELVWEQETENYRKWNF